ncbi:hypothetical protein D9613_008023 [Agrocybe pediades]|uniref:Uncharacterized protein n=1 Tax=Agrocybe pediades TaxID=84607 RepID=A0A8H4VLL7_9AGAR|nr:hypothetical protein D9613_008023 [Agrocybe pediades]
MSNSSSPLRNVTLDATSDPSSSLSFSFEPTQCENVGWRTVASAETGPKGTYRNCSEGAGVGPSAILQFTGVAFYYVSPYLPGESVQLTLDGADADEIDLTPPKSVNASKTNIFLKKLNLSDGTHTLVVRPGSNSSDLNLGSVIITQTATNITSSFPSTITPTGTSLPINPGAAAAAQAAADPPPDKFAIGFGSTFGAVSLFVLIAIFFVLGRRRRELRMTYDRKTPVPPIHSVSRGGPIGTMGVESQYHDDRELGIDDSLGGGGAGGGGYPPLVYVTTSDKVREASPPPPLGGAQRTSLPSVAHGSFTTYDWDRDRDRDTRDLGSRDGGGNGGDIGLKSMGSRTASSPGGSPAGTYTTPGYARSLESRETMSTFTAGMKLEPVRRPTPQY